MKKILTEMQKEWLAALRSGEYQQTRHQLQSHYGYCCLGVACIIAEKHGIPVYKDNGGSMIKGGDLYNQPKVREWLGLTSDYGKINDKENGSLTDMNDNDGMSFSRLADIIEDNADVLFVQDAS